MTKEFREKMAALRASAAKLNASTDAASKVVREVERFLGEELSIGVSAQVDFRFDPYEEDDQDDVGWVDEAGNRSRPDRCYSLAYGRLGDRFRLFVSQALSGYKLDDRDMAAYHEIPVDRLAWSSCSRDMKLESFAKLPELLGELADRAEKLAQGADEATATVKDLLDAMVHPAPDAPDHIEAMFGGVAGVSPGVALPPQCQSPPTSGRDALVKTLTRGNRKG